MNEPYPNDVGTAMTSLKAKVASIDCALLRETCRIFLEKFGEVLPVTAAANKNHHAYPGGLAVHTANMMELAEFLASPTRCNRDLLLAGTLFHDSGKIFEHLHRPNGKEENLQGELIGHISADILIVDKCLAAAVEKLGVGKDNHTQETRTHLIHLIASHHGKAEWGSPVPPKTKEAFVLHTIDMLDAHLEMYDQALSQPPLYTSPTGSTVHENAGALKHTVSSSLSTRS